MTREARLLSGTSFDGSTRGSDERPRGVSRVSASYWTQRDEVAKITKGSVSNSLKLQRDGGRDRDRTGDPLLAKQRQLYYVIGPSSFVLRHASRLSLFFGRFWTQIGPKFLG
jgi:hypothetical protein